MRVGYLAHSFDLLNIADLDLIAQARARCTRLVAGVLSDELVENLYGRPPVVPLSERMALVEHVRGIDEVLAHGAEQTPSLADDVELFFAADHSAALLSPRALPLAADRETASAAVRDALRPTSRVAVA